MNKILEDKKEKTALFTDLNTALTKRGEMALLDQKILILLGASVKVIELKEERQIRGYTTVQWLQSQRLNIKDLLKEQSKQ